MVYRKVVIKFRRHTNENDFYAAGYVLEFVWYWLEDPEEPSAQPAAAEVDEDVNLFSTTESS